MLKISEAQNAALSEGPITRQMVHDLRSRDHRIAAMSDENLQLIARDGVSVATDLGFQDYGSQLWVTLTMLRVHPRFYTHGSIKRSLASTRNTLSEKRRIAHAIEKTEGDDWDKAGEAGGYEDYYAKILKPSA